ncbi:MAG: Na+/H+ antiporter subunit E [Spirochaetaceae bacterium]
MISKQTRWNVVRIGLTTVYLMVGWVLFTWTVDPRFLLIGLGFCFIVALLTYSVFIEQGEAARRSLIPRIYLLVVYSAVLIFEMYVASFRVLWNILRGRINPGVVHFRTRLSSDIARVALTNSITLTPGTITLDLDDDHLIVHWLDARTTHSKYAGELVKGTYERILKRIWT